MALTRTQRLERISALAKPLLTDGDLPERVSALNEIRRALHELSPFAGEPVDIIEWVPGEEVEGNSYNPNSVAPPEMELLRLSIMADGYTQPIVTNHEGDTRVVVDGFHRNRVGKECDDVRERVRGYLPVVQIRSDRTDSADRMASTIRHNRARGKHQVLAMSDIVLELKRRNWSDAKIGKELGMDPDEVLRLAQITGLAEAFKDREFSEAWEAVLSAGDEDDLDDTSVAPTCAGCGVDGAAHVDGCELAGISP
jgi:ParB-like chromosome segregation protein Spo0J